MNPDFGKGYLSILTRQLTPEVWKGGIALGKKIAGLVFALLVFFCIGGPIKGVERYEEVFQPETKNFADRAEEYFPVKQNIKTATVDVLVGKASWYGPEFDGRLTASGEVYNQSALTAAHRELEFGTKVRVTNLSNGKSVLVTINDRGPYVAGRHLDLSRAAAEQVDMVEQGVVEVKMEVIP
ncbi:MAG TPA: septal ring lytic transglycosylase RlpA family protein [Thermoanaerobacterales bacterium]|nr:septal ring lytic transglycosylase RlpA family protein [Thermoanaerobacterales bacterium]